jgi:predicted enzyme related to lactoylglutathione lyase
MYIQHITLAVTHLPQMLAFYDTVFHANLKPLGDGPLYKGSFAGQTLLFCPNEIAGVDARQNRHQFRIAVPNLPAVRETILNSGGAIINEDSDSHGKRLIGVRDPDGNTYEFIQE